MLLDYPFAALDRQTMARVFERLFGAAGLLTTGTTTSMLVSNDPEIVRRASHIITLRDGNLVHQGSPNLAARSTPLSSPAQQKTAISESDKEKDHDISASEGLDEATSLMTTFRACKEQVAHGGLYIVPLLGGGLVGISLFTIGFPLLASVNPFSLEYQTKLKCWR